MWFGPPQLHRLEQIEFLLRSLLLTTPLLSIYLWMPLDDDDAQFRNGSNLTKHHENVARVNVSSVPNVDSLLSTNPVFLRSRASIVRGTVFVNELIFGPMLGTIGVTNLQSQRACSCRLLG